MTSEPTPQAARAPRLRLPASLSLPVALAVAAIVFFAKIGTGGIWDPHELSVADLARRVAVNVFHAGESLSLVNGENGLPTLGDLGRGDLPIVSIALGFKLFGLHEWAGRLPLGVWALAGVGALYFAMSRLYDRRAALYSALALTTMPLYFVQARTMLGDAVTMAAATMAFSGLAVATFHRAASGESAEGARRDRLTGLVLGALGLAAGFWSRGALLGVAMPALGVGLAWGVRWATAPRRFEKLGDLAGLAAFVVGTLAAAIGLYALFTAKANDVTRVLGLRIVGSSGKFPTYDFVVHYLGHALFPWSAFIPLAAGRLFRAPPLDDDADEVVVERDADLRLSLLVGSAVALGVYSVVAPRAGYLAFGAPALLAAIAAVAIRDFELGAPPSRAMAVGVGLFAALFLRDYNMFPEKGLSAFAVPTTPFPESFKAQASATVLASTALFVLVVFFAWLESDADGERAVTPLLRALGLVRDDGERPTLRAALAPYEAWPDVLRKAWNGNLFFLLVVVETALAATAAMTWLGLRVLGWKQIAQISENVRIVMLNAFWVLPVALVGAVWAVMALRDAFRAAFRLLRITRGFATVAVGVLVAGGLLGVGYYPALAAQLSPKDVFEAYQRLHKTSEPLGLLGVAGKAASYYSGSDVKSLLDVPSAFTWLMTSGGERRWLAVRNEDLARLNSQWRARPGKKANLPVLDARSSQILLVSNQLAASEKSQSPYDAFVLDDEPKPANRLDVNLQDTLLCLGWDVYDATGQRMSAVVPAHKYHFRIYYKVLTQVTQDWETFIHIDGFHRRFNGDHKTLGGKYPLTLWQPGDYVVDDYEMQLEPNFTPGSYTVFFGLYVGDMRLAVKSGRHDDNRIDAGQLIVK